MTAITRCPQCNTRFKATQEQLDAHQGLVRCGRCQTVFNAVEHLLDTEPSPQLSLPIMPEEQPQKPPETQTESGPSPAQPEPAETAGEGNVIALEQQEIIAEQPFQAGRRPPRKRRSWPWAIGSLLLLAAMLAQAAYYFRVDLAARMPGLKPVLQAYCQLLACSIPLPRKADLVSIESSDMEASPAPVSAIALSAILRNRAPYVQAFPTLELTLTDVQDKTVARRFISPHDYLKPEENEAAGIPPHRETSIKLYLDTADLKPAGYRLFLFYP